MANEVRNQPVESWKINSVKLSIFENDRNGDGPGRKFYRAYIDKRYRDQKSGEWKSTNSYDADELLALQFMINRAVNYIVDRSQ